MADNEKLFSIQDVLSTFSKVLAVDAKELVELTKDKDLSNINELTSVLNTLAVDKRNDLIESSVSKGFKQAAKKTEKLIAEHFPNEDFTGKQQEEIFEHIKLIKSTAKPTDNSKKITIEQAMSELPEVKAAFENVKKYEKDLQDLKSSHEQYKINQKVLSRAVDTVTEMGAQWSKDPLVRARQIEMFEREVTKYKYKDDNGNFIPLDDDGEYPRHNKEKGTSYDFATFIKGLTVVDFKVDEPEKQSKTVPLPNGTELKNTFGYTEDTLKTLSYDDYKAANEKGDTAKANFIKEYVISRQINDSKTV